MLSGSSWNPFRKEAPKDLVRKWKACIRSEVRRTEREVQALILEQKKAATPIREAAKRNDMASARMLAKEVVRLRVTVGRLAANKANMLSLSDQMTQTLAMSKVAGTIQASTAVMKTMNSLIRVPELQGTVKEMAREMAKAGFIREMMDEAVDSAVDSEGIEEEVDEAVDAVLLEVTGETMAQLAATPSRRPAVAAEEDSLQAALEGLRAS